LAQQSPIFIGTHVTSPRYQVEPLKRSGEVRTDRREAGIDGGEPMRLHRFLAGNPAISCPYGT
jgi:hypothetical protein